MCGGRSCTRVRVAAPLTRAADKVVGRVGQRARGLLPQGRVGVDRGLALHQHREATAVGHDRKQRQLRPCAHRVHRSRAWRRGRGREAATLARGANSRHAACAGRGPARHAGTRAAGAPMQSGGARLVRCRLKLPAVDSRRDATPGTESTSSKAAMPAARAAAERMAADGLVGGFSLQGLEDTCGSPASTTLVCWS